MKAYKFYILFIIINLQSVCGFSQLRCKDFYKNNRCYTLVEKDFKQYGQARGALIEVNQTYKLQAVLFGQKDYIISVCSEMRSVDIHFKIINIDTKEVIYDNENDDFNNWIGFPVKETIKVLIEVTLQTDKKDDKDPALSRTCIGVQMFWRKIPQIGFPKKGSE
jgi:hypothetical protein